jgi:hypothetical protein
VKSETLVSTCHFEAQTKCLKCARQWEKMFLRMLLLLHIHSLVDKEEPANGKGTGECEE